MMMSGVTEEEGRIPPVGSPHQAILDGDLPELTRWIRSTMGNEDASHRALLVESREEHFGATPLFTACYVGRLDMVRFLVEVCCADVESTQTDDAETPLHVSCKRGLLDIVRYLVEDCHANVEAQTRHGDTPLVLACQCRQSDVIRYLAMDWNVTIPKKALHQTIFNRDLTNLKRLLESRSKEHVVDPEVGEATRRGRDDYFAATLLFTACFVGRLDMVQYLVREQGHGHQVQSTQTNDDETPLHMACEKGHLPIVRYLVEECHADIEVTTRKGATPLLIACQNRRIHVARYLAVERKANVEQQLRCSHARPIHIACWKGDVEMIRFLVHECRARVDNVATMKGTKLPLDLLLEQKRCSARNDDERRARIDHSIRLLIAAHPNLPPTSIQTLWDRSSWEDRLYWASCWNQGRGTRSTDPPPPPPHRDDLGSKSRPTTTTTTTTTKYRFPLHSLLKCTDLLDESIKIDWKAVFRHFGATELLNRNDDGLRPMDAYFQSQLGTHHPLNLRMIQSLLDTEPRASISDASITNQPSITSSSSSSSSRWAPIIVVADRCAKSSMEGHETVVDDNVESEAVIVVDILYRMIRIQPATYIAPNTAVMNAPLLTLGRTRIKEFDE